MENESGQRQDEIQEHLYWQIWKSMRILYGGKIDNKFIDFTNWLDSIVKRGKRGKK